MDIVNRLEICPTLIRAFYKKDIHHSASDYVTEFPSPEIYVYTWKDATLREISYTIIRTTKLNEIKSLSFQFVCPNFNEGGWDMKDLGIIDLSDDFKINKTLEDYGFIPGFMLDVAYTT